jgi:hypothetical protein
MAHQVQKHPQNPTPSLYHYGLIKILIENELYTRDDSWGDFLNRNVFVPPPNSAIPISTDHSEPHMSPQHYDHSEPYPSPQCQSQKRKIKRTVNKTLPVPTRHFTRSMVNTTAPMPQPTITTYDIISFSRR